MKILVTGGAGFIEQYVRALLAGQYPETDAVQITVLDKLTTLPGHEAVIHFAAQTHVDRSLISGSSFVRPNAFGTQTLLKVSARVGVERVVCVSTDEVYGSFAHGSRAETKPLRPNSPYAVSKAASDLLAVHQELLSGRAGEI